MSLPNTFIVGVQKAGTTAFYDWLSQHPDIYAPKEIKDIHFFSLDEYYNKGTIYLEKLYSGAKNEPIILNAGVNYMYQSIALKRIKAINPNIKILIVLRDPIKRAFSAYNYFYKLGLEDLSFEDALQREKENTFQKTIEKAAFTYLDHGKYFRQLSKVFSEFPRENVQILIYEKLVSNKDQNMKDVFEFLDIDSSFQCSYVNSNVTGKARIRILNKFLSGENDLKRFVQKVFPYKKLFSLKFRNKISIFLLRLNTKSAVTNKLNEQTYRKLQSSFEEEIEKLSELLSVNLKDYWKY